MNPEINPSSIPYDIILRSKYKDLDPAEEAFLTEWRTNPLNESIFKEVMEIMYTESQLKIYNSLHPEASWKELERKIDLFEQEGYKPIKPIANSGRYWLYASAAASLAFLLLFTFLYKKEMILVSAKSSYKSIKFSNGIYVRLKGESRLKYQEGIWMAPTHFELLDGDALFKIMHKADRVVEVNFGKEKVRDLGTEFEIIRSFTTMEILVRTGKVLFLSEKLNEPERTLSKGDDFVFNEISRGATWMVHKDSLPESQITSFRFYNQRMGEVAEKMERAIGIKIRFENTGLMERRITASFTNMDPDKIMEQIGLTLNLKLNKEKDTYFLSAQ